MPYMNVLDQHMQGYVICVNLDDLVMGIIKWQKKPLRGSWLDQHGEPGVDTP
jgi:hypothetical protein